MLKITFHTPKSLIKYGWKQKATWIGVALFIWVYLEFGRDFISLGHNVLKSPELIHALIPTIGAAIMVIVNKWHE